VTALQRRCQVIALAFALSVMLPLPAAGTASEHWVVLYGDEQWMRPLGNLSGSTTITFSIEVEDDDRVDVELRDKDGELLRLRNDVRKAEIIWYVEPGDGADHLVVKRVDTDYYTKFNWGLRVWDPDQFEDGGDGPSWWDENQLLVYAAFGLGSAVTLTAAVFAGPFTNLCPIARLQSGFLRRFRWN
jgi:hypothetical protein